MTRIPSACFYRAQSITVLVPPFDPMKNSSLIHYLKPIIANQTLALKLYLICITGYTEHCIYPTGMFYEKNEWQLFHHLLMAAPLPCIFY